MTEADIQTAIRIRASQLNITLFRNNVGESIDAKSGRRIRYGLCRGSSDLIGWTPVTITADHVGSVIAQFTAIEVKTPTGRVRPEQQQFIAVVSAAGGRALIARSPEDIA